MKITAEISLYPIHERYNKDIFQFIEQLHANENILTETNVMSTILTGEYDEILTLLNYELKAVFTNQKAVCILKLSNGCLVNGKSE